MMMINSIIIFYLKFMFYSAEINSDDEDGKNVFDLFVFTQTWPTSECVNWKAQNEKNACILPSKKDTWTIHGIWPSKKSISIPQQPAFCRTSSTKFDVESMDSETLEQLKKYWPSIHKGKNTNSIQSMFKRLYIFVFSFHNLLI